MNKYHGSRRQGECVLAVQYCDGDVPFAEEVITPKASLSVRNHSPTGFEWGYGGSGPAQLALAILLHFFGNLPIEERPEAVTARTLAERAYQLFKADVVCFMPSGGWDLTDQEIKLWFDDPIAARKHFRAKWDGARSENVDAWRA